LYTPLKTLVNEIRDSKAQNRLLYTKQMRVKPKAKIKSESELENILENNDIKWKSVYSQIFKATIDTKIRTFQCIFNANNSNK
jgi:hypothetical protein